MKWTITEDTAFPVVRIELGKGEEIKAESGAMVAMSEGLSLSGKMDGGFLKSMARKFSGESFFMQNISSDNADGWVLLAPPTPGSVIPLEVSDGREYCVQKDGFLAGTAGIDVSTKAQNLARGVLSGEGLFVVKISGEGTAFLATYGSVLALDVPQGESVLVDNGHMVAWEADMEYDITKAASSWISAMTAGSGIGCRFHGPGRVVVQTRNPYALGAWMSRFLPMPEQR